MTAPVIPNQVFVACTLVDPTNNECYRKGQADVPVGQEIPPTPNIVRLGCTLIDPVTGIPYH